MKKTASTEKLLEEALLHEFILSQKAYQHLSPSPEFNNGMFSLISSATASDKAVSGSTEDIQKPRIYPIRRIIRAAVIAAVIFSLVLLAGCSVGNIIASFGLYYLTDEGDTFRLHRDDNAAIVSIEEERLLRFSYVPEGFFHEYTSKGTNSVRYSYTTTLYKTADRMSISYNQSAASGKPTFSDRYEYEVKDICGYEMLVLAIKGSGINYYWGDMHYNYSLRIPYELGEEEAIKIISGLVATKEGELKTVINENEDFNIKDEIVK